MDSFDIQEPGLSDYYEDLELQQYASLAEIRAAFRRLAKKFHPDKTESKDAREFRKVREAYEFLVDKSRRSAYDARYADVQAAWSIYRERQADQRRHEEQRRAEAEARQRAAAEAERIRAREAEQRAARERAEAERKAAEAERVRRAKEEERAAREEAERQRIRDQKAREAEERSREAARRAREQQEIAAKARLRREKEREAEKKSQEVARRVRLEQERLAQERLKRIVIKEKQDAVCHNWGRMREAADRREAGAERAQPGAPPATSPCCAHLRFGWPRAKGRATCAFCGEVRRKWFFRCPECGVAACAACKDKPSGY